MNRIIKIMSWILSVILILGMCVWEYNTQNGRKLITNIKIDRTIEKSEEVILDAKLDLIKAEIAFIGIKSITRDTDTLKLMYNFHKESIITKPTYEQLKSHIVYITGIVPNKKYENYMIERGKSWVGTGFVFKVSDKYTWIITNKHVAGIFANKEEETTELYIGDTKEERVKAKIVRFHPKYDVALLVVYGKLEGKTQIKGLSMAKPQDKVYVVGHHLGRQYIYGEGVFAGYDRDFELIQVPVLFGNSGSAVFDKNGYVVGLIFAINRATMFCVDATHGLAVPGRILQDFLVNWSF